MYTAAQTRPVLIFTWGNPSRGDDALGPALHDLIEARQRRDSVFDHVDILTDFQLQVEHVLDLRQREWILFVDASVDATPPYAFYRLQPARDVACTTHAMSPASVLAVYRQLYEQPAPPAFMLSVRGYEFDLGQPLSARARQHLDKAFAFVRGLPLAPPFGEPDARQQYCT